jgi:response regulator NasT
VLVAEDQALIRLDLCQMLERAGFDVCAQATDGLQAVELARAKRPDLAIVDVKMPRLDGIEAPRRIVTGATGARRRRQRPHRAHS